MDPGTARKQHYPAFFSVQLSLCSNKNLYIMRCVTLSGTIQQWCVNQSCLRLHFWPFSSLAGFLFHLGFFPLLFLPLDIYCWTTSTFTFAYIEHAFISPKCPASGVEGLKKGSLQLCWMSSKDFFLVFFFTSNKHNPYLHCSRQIQTLNHPDISRQAGCCPVLFTKPWGMLFFCLCKLLIG